MLLAMVVNCIIGFHHIGTANLVADSKFWFSGGGLLVVWIMASPELEKIVS